MTSLSQHMPYVTAFPKALGTGIVISTPQPMREDARAGMREFLETYEQALSRFRDDSIVSEIGTSAHGGSFDFPDWSEPLFDLYDALFAATSGAMDPCVGEDLIRLGYDASLSFTVDSGAAERLGALRGRATWGNDVERHGTTLVTHQPVHLDFGACGKGYLVDLLGEELDKTFEEFVIDAGGDLLVRSTEPIAIALEDPEDPTRAIGIAHVANCALCASAPSRRHWNMPVNEHVQLSIHHLLNAIDGLPVQQIEATWTCVSETAASCHPNANHHPTALADGLATALFTTGPQRLRRDFSFTCVTLNADRHAVIGGNFPGEVFSN